jgi:hypothetical protein
LWPADDGENLKIKYPLTEFVMDVQPTVTIEVKGKSYPAKYSVKSGVVTVTALGTGGLQKQILTIPDALGLK